MATLKDVAKYVGVSPSTVSRALSGNFRVNDATRQRILDAVDALDYQPNTLARGLKEGSTKTIGLLIPDIGNPIFPILVRGAEHQARREGYSLILCNTDEDQRLERHYIDTLRTMWVDGLLIASVQDGVFYAKKFALSNYPVVSIIRSIGSEVDSVMVENYQGARNAVQFLLRRGCKRIALLNGTLKLDLYRERFRGYQSALSEAGIPFDKDLVIDASEMGSYTAMLETLRKGYAIDGVFATSDPNAVYAMQAIKAFGLSIPNDISVIGFDNLEISSLMEPPLTTISQPFYELGQTAVKVLLRRIAACREGYQSSPEHHELKTELIIRKSTK